MVFKEPYNKSFENQTLAQVGLKNKPGSHPLDNRNENVFKTDSGNMYDNEIYNATFTIMAPIIGV